MMTKEELIPELAKELFRIDVGLMNPDQPINWERSTEENPRGFKTEITVWEALARTAINYLYERL